MHEVLGNLQKFQKHLKGWLAKEFRALIPFKTKKIFDICKKATFIPQILKFGGFII